MEPPNRIHAMDSKQKLSFHHAMQVIGFFAKAFRRFDSTTTQQSQRRKKKGIGV